MHRQVLVSIIILSFLFTACSPTVFTEPTIEESLSTPTQLPPTETPIPSETPLPTPIPGSLVIPLDNLENQIPWLPMGEDGEILSTNYIGFNTRVSPFDEIEVRQAFALAINKQELFELVTHLARNRPNIDSFVIASTFTPPEILGRDLTADVGIQFDPAEAQAKLREAGYDDPSSFPVFTVRVPYGGNISPASNELLARAIIGMWEDNLGITSAKLEVVTSNYIPSLQTNPADVHFLAWVADSYDPDNFLRESFFAESEELDFYNFSGYVNSDYKALVDNAAAITDPAKRQLLYIQAEQMLADEVPLIPLYYNTR